MRHTFLEVRSGSLGSAGSVGLGGVVLSDCAAVEARAAVALVNVRDLTMG